MLPTRQRGGLNLLRSTAALGFYLANQNASVDWIWEPGSGCGLDLGVWNWILLFFPAFGSPHVHFDCYLHGFVSPGKASGANPLVSLVSKTSVGWPGEANLHVPVLPQGLGSPELQS